MKETVLWPQVCIRRKTWTLFVDSYRPQTPRYDRQQAALAEYRVTGHPGRLGSRCRKARRMKPGMTDPRIGLLERPSAALG